VDNLDPFPDPQHVVTAARFSPDRRVTAAAAAGAVVAVLVALVTGDRVGQVLALTAAVLLLISVASDLLFAPRLVATGTGLVIRSPFTRASLEWDRIEAVEVVTRMRLGLRNTALVVDAGEVLEEFTRRTLGATPEDALDVVLAFRPR
jgi:hypothetical protein